MDSQYWVYILTSRPKGVLYIGITNDLIRRVWEHRLKQVKGFTARYNVEQLVYFEAFLDPAAAISREKQLKKWSRAWKEELIGQTNPAWRDLFDDICR